MIRWEFPLPTCHHGVPLGNGRMGVLVWGEGTSLKLTIGRADFWDHRGGMKWTPEMSYARIRALLEAKDEAGLRAIFESKGADGKRPMQPTILPVGRVELALPSELKSAELEETTGVARLTLASGAVLEMEIAPRDPVLLVRCGAVRPGVSVMPAGVLCKGSFGNDKHAWAERGLPEPEMLERAELAGFVQALPADPAMCLGLRFDGGELYLATDRGPDAPAAVVECGTLLARAIAEGAARFSADARAWWAEYWGRAPKVEIPNPVLDQLYRYGMYKLAGSTNPRGVACGLQGPWIEDDRTPPWSSDYHFNINVQMCYGPAFAGGQGKHLRPLWKMLREWEPMLREHARLFVGVTDNDAGGGLMLPHAVDDRCTNMGGFWTGTVDHGCTAWVARMMYDAWRYGLEDDTFLETTAYPWLAGALNVYRGMAEKRGETYHFAVSVSPEYRGSAMNAWGEDASFQLAACHSLFDALEVVCARLGKPFRAEWAEFRKGLPQACVQSQEGAGWTQVAGGQIMLWKDTPLEESHRHHSHLGAIAPFETIDPLSPEWRDVVDRSMARWIEKGMGNWSGWCLSWASQLHTRVGNASTAEFILEAFVRYFTNHGHGVFHNVVHRGFSTMGGTALKDWNWQAMQLDGGQGACSAVMDMLAHDRRPAGPGGNGTVALFAGCPARWGRVAFEGMSLPGAFKVSATREGGKLTRLEVHSQRGGTFRYLTPAGETRSVETRAGEVVKVV